MKEKILQEIIDDLADNYMNDKSVLASLLDEVISDALSISNRLHKIDKEAQLKILKSNIKKAVKTIYLQRGSEDTKSRSESGISNSYDDAIETMKNDIIRENKRLFI